MLVAQCILNAAEFLSTPSARRATTSWASSSPTAKFLSTPSARRATQGGQPDRQAHAISIHALREEGDMLVAQCILNAAEFLSTPSARRATAPPAQPRPSPRISIHALREEGDGW